MYCLADVTKKVDGEINSALFLGYYNQISTFVSLIMWLFVQTVKCFCFHSTKRCSMYP